jgi:hypothetical protein
MSEHTEHNDDFDFDLTEKVMPTSVQQHLCKVIEYAYWDEWKDYRDRNPDDRRKHIFVHLKALADWVGLGTSEEPLEGLPEEDDAGGVC